MSVNPNLGHPVKNKFKVQVKQWKKWSNFARKHFNDMYEMLRPSMQTIYMAPHSPLLTKAQWDVLRWNIAWESANTINKRVKNNGK